MKKRATVLLEILIALTLVMVALVPLIRQPIQFQLAEKKQIQRIEADRIAAWTYSEIREQFLKGEFRWEEIPKFQEESKVYELDGGRAFTLKTLEEKEHEGKISRLVGVHLRLKNAKATYRLIVEKQVEKNA